VRVCVIGAGASGLVAAKKLLDAGIEPVLFERNADLGGNWLFSAPGSSVYRSTHLISSKRLTGSSSPTVAPGSWESCRPSSSPAP
jgi:cation diffusion facilitator CzcD-associated flavoprotein CzcO